MKEDLKSRLNEVITRLQSKELLQGSGLGNEIGFYIFDYPPEEELEIRKHIEFIMAYLAKNRTDLRVKHVNLFELVIGYLEKRNLLDRALKIQREKGDQELIKALKGPLHEGKVAQAFLEEAHPESHDLIIVSGVGSAYPMLRSHTLLNNLHSLVESKPVVIFYPGTYDGQGLRLFGRLPETNYYRAFRLVP